MRLYINCYAQAIMKRVLKRKFSSYIRSNEFLKAAITKNIYSLAAIIMSLIWLKGWGLNLIFSNSSLPYVKVVTIIIGYGIPITNLYFDYKNIVLKRNHQAYIRQNRAEKMHNKAYKRDS